MALSSASRSVAVVLAIGLACSKGFVALVDLARELPVIGAEPRAAGTEADVVAAGDADASQVAARAEQYDASGQSGEMPGGKPDDESDRRVEKRMMGPVMWARLENGPPMARFEFAFPPELQ